MKSIKAIIKSRIISAPYYGKTIRAFTDGGLSFVAEVEVIEDHGYLGFWVRLNNPRGIMWSGKLILQRPVDQAFHGFIDQFKLVAARKTDGT